MTAKAVRGLVAIAAVVFLLSSGLGSTALWSAQALMPTGQVTSGQLRLEQEPMTITLTRDGTTTDLSTTLGQQALRPGDVLTYRVPVTPVLQGTSLEATLALDVSGLVVGALRDVVGKPAVTVQTDPRGLLSTSSGPWNVTPALNRSRVTGIITVTIPATAGSALQGQTLDPGNITWTLTQV
ncbi:alternate-type signal peptide domain-containing protein [Georgenia yuyongxinii]|uniref:Alternate-type signal peptide domain-containing protein n=1 Tax=Georgenia yuyongxinii TaxID=2589797 RepID=A0A5B8C0V0_9MICO|nr:alternate-type signal peptide domain-containing protein [Georgenia yuyongxinii]QDC23717.1 alternate-type signal peptide domain-containing protein [Georgenia yuyongxinii]